MRPFKVEVFNNKASERSSLIPYAVEDVSVWEYPNVDVGHQDVVKPTLLLVSEECVWHPNFLGVSHR